jgi:type II secretory pathway pseudopilin PulG
MRSKKVQFILMTAVIAALLVSLAPQVSQAANAQNQALENAITQALATSAEGDPSAVQCILNTVIADLGELSACNNDATCKANVAVDMVLNILLCINPENNNVGLLSCILDPLIDLFQINATCGSDRWCRIQKTIAVGVELMNCVKNYRGTVPPAQ